MNSHDLAEYHGFIPLSEWIEVGLYILGKATKDNMPKGRLPKAPVVCVMRFCGDIRRLALLGSSEHADESDILYFGYSSQLGVEQGERLFNMRYNHQSTNKNIRNGMAKMYDVLPGRVEVGWRFCKDEAEAKRISSELKKAFRDEHGILPPWNRRM